MTGEPLQTTEQLAESFQTWLIDNGVKSLTATKLQDHSQITVRFLTLGDVAQIVRIENAGDFEKLKVSARKTFS